MTPLSPLDFTENSHALAALRWRWAVVALAGLASVAVGGWLIGRAWQPDYALRWMLPASIVLARQLWLLWRGLPSNHRSSESRLLASLGYGNGITIGRGLLNTLVAGFILTPPLPGVWAWLPAALYTVSIVLDYVDGWVARATNHATRLGEMLDMEFDVLGQIVAVLLGIVLGHLPLWYLPVGFARDLFLLGHWVLRRLGRPIYELPPSSNRRLIAGFEMGFLSVALWPVMTPPTSTLAAALFILPMIVSFGRDWLVTSGAVSVTSPRYLRARRLASGLFERWLPLAARLLAGGAGTLLVARLLTIGTPAAAVLVALMLPLLAALVLGAAGRGAALLLTALLLYDITAFGFRPLSSGLLLACALYVLQWGSGAFALWQPEERLLRRRFGAEPPV